MYSPSSRSSPTGALRRQVSEGPIGDFKSVIENTVAANWQKRASAFQKLIDDVPEDIYEEEAGTKWYNTPATLRHLAISVSELLKDPRSTVVKRTCLGLTTLFGRCKGDARYLFKDLMPTILSVHAQTVQVIRQVVENMILEAIPDVPCKMVMPLWMERLRIDRSRTVRDACALYLGHSLQHWTEEGYLTDEIWFQVGRTLLGSVRDPSPNVRAYSKQVLEKIKRSHPHIFDQLLSDTEGPAGTDVKLHRWLKGLGTAVSSADAAEDLSVASRFSYNSDMRSRAKTVASSPSTTQGRTRKQEEHVPISISLQSPPRGKSKRSSNGSVGSNTARSTAKESPGRSTPPRPPPKRAPVDKPKDSYQSSAPDKNEELTDDEEEITKQKSNETEDSVPSFPSDLDLQGWRQTIQKSVETTKGGESPRYQNYLSSPPERKPEIAATAATPETPQPFQPTAATVSALANDGNKGKKGDKPEDRGEEHHEDDDKFISNVESLKKFSKRRTRSSLLIQERLRMSSSMEDDEYNQAANTVQLKRSDEENSVPNPGPTPKSSAKKPPVFPGTKSSSSVSSQAPEHMVIAIRLLKAHKDHVDTIMETLRIEMDTLRDFDKLLEEAGRPTEEEVLDYYESVGLCLEQRAAAGARLQQELNRVSRGEPPME